MGTGDEEADWIARIRNGETGAYEAFVTKYQRMIHDLTFRMTGSLTDAEDLAQETFIQAYRQLPKFRGEAKFSSWLYRIGINTCLNWRKSRQRRERYHQDFADQPPPGGVSEDVTTRVQAALLQLPEKQRAAIILTVYEEMNHAEAARALGCSETTISWRVHMARKKLKRLLQCD